MITYIPRERLEPHPDNPRKELGDLTELAASISARGWTARMSASRIRTTGRGWRK